MAKNGDSKREAAALCLAKGMTQVAAAAETGVGHRTLHRWLAEDASFRLLVAERRSEMFDQIVGNLSAIAGKAVDTLDQLLDSESEGIRLSAARTVLESSVNLRDRVEVAKRVEELEARLNSEP